jgi:hypothetical protein
MFDVQNKGADDSVDTDNSRMEMLSFSKSLNASKIKRMTSIEQSREKNGVNDVLNMTCSAYELQRPLKVDGRLELGFKLNLKDPWLRSLESRFNFARQIKLQEIWKNKSVQKEFFKEPIFFSGEDETIQETVLSTDFILEARFKTRINFNMAGIENRMVGQNANA